MMFHRALKALSQPRRPRDAAGGRWVMVPKTADYPSHPGLRQRRPSSTSARRSAAEKRRKNMTALSVFIIATFVGGLIPPLRLLLWWPCLVASVLLIAYIIAALVFAARSVGMSTPTLETAEVRPPEAAGGGL